MESLELLKLQKKKISFIKKAIKDYKKLLDASEMLWASTRERRMVLDMANLASELKAHHGLCHYTSRTSNVFNLRNIVNLRAFGVGSGHYICLTPSEVEYAPITFDKRVEILEKILYCLEHPDGIKFVGSKARRLFGDIDARRISEIISEALNLEV